MRLGLLADSHNSMPNLRKAVDFFRREGLETIVHCGDMTSLEVALQLVEFRVIYTFGNGDRIAHEIRNQLMYYRPDNFGGLVFRGEFNGVNIAVTHGHLPGILEELIHCGEYAYVLHGHSHRREDVLVNATRVINPGALGGIHVESRSCAILDIEKGELRFHNLD